MKNKQRFLKIVAVVAIIAMTVLTLASCSFGGASSSSSDTSGTHGDLAWEYKKDGQTLTITGSGAMTNFKGTDDIAWGSVTKSVKKVIVGAGITTVADYAFFGMTALEEVALPESVTSIGKLSFAYTTALTKITLPKGLTSIGYGAFETCGVEAIALPEKITAIPERAFIYCDDLTSVTGEGVVSIGKEAFAYCSDLKTVKLAAAFDKTSGIGEGAFDKSGMNTDAITVADNKITITYKFVDAADQTKMLMGYQGIRVMAESDPYLFDVPAIEGYTPVLEKITVYPGVIDQTVVVTYNEIVDAPESEETDTSVETGDVGQSDPEDDKLDPMTIVALVVTVLIIIGIIVGTIIFIRNDKKKSEKKTGKSDKKNKK